MCGLMPWVRAVFGSDVWEIGFGVLWSLHLDFMKTMLIIDSLWWALAVSGDGRRMVEIFNILGAA